MFPASSRLAITMFIFFSLARHNSCVCAKLRQLCLRHAGRTRRDRASCLRSNGSGVLGERWLSSVIPSVSKSCLALLGDKASKQLLDTLQQLGRASSHSSDGAFAHVCITVGQIRWSMSVVLLSRESQITLVEFSVS